MHLLRALFLVAVFPLTGFSVSGTAIPGGRQSTPYVITVSGSYYLAAERVMLDASKNAIEVAASNVTIDLNGMVLRFDTQSGTGRGIFACTVSNLEICHGTITRTPDHGIHAPAVVGLRVIDIRIVDTGGAGIDAAGADFLIENCTISEASSHGIALEASPGANRVSRNLISECGGAGLKVSGCFLVFDNAVAGNLGYGVDAFGSATIRGNSLDGNRRGGVYAGGGGRATIEGNTFVDWKQAWAGSPAPLPRYSVIVAPDDVRGPLVRNNVFQEYSWPFELVGPYRDGGGNIRN